MRQGVKALQVRAGTVYRGHAHKGKVSGRYEAGSNNTEKEVDVASFFRLRSSSMSLRDY